MCDAIETKLAYEIKANPEKWSKLSNIFKKYNYNVLTHFSKVPDDFVVLVIPSKKIVLTFNNLTYVATGFYNGVYNLDIKSVKAVDYITTDGFNISADVDKAIRGTLQKSGQKPKQHDLPFVEYSEKAKGGFTDFDKVLQEIWKDSKRINEQFKKWSQDVNTPLKVTQITQQEFDELYDAVDKVSANPLKYSRFATIRKDHVEEDLKAGLGYLLSDDTNCYKDVVYHNNGVVIPKSVVEDVNKTVTPRRKSIEGYITIIDGTKVTVQQFRL